MRFYILLLLVTLSSSQLLGGLLGGGGNGGGLLGGLTGSVSGTLGGLSNTVGGVIGGVKNAVSNILSSLKNVVASLHGHVSGLVGGFKGDPVPLDATTVALRGLVGTSDTAGAVAGNATGDAAEILKLLSNVTDPAVRSELYWMLIPDVLKSLLYVHPMLAAVPTVFALPEADQTKLKDAFTTFSSSGHWPPLRAQLFKLAPTLGEAIETIYRYYLVVFDKLNHDESKEIQVTFERGTMLAVLAAVTGAQDYTGIDFSSGVARYQNLSKEAKAEYIRVCPEMATAFEDVLSGAGKSLTKPAFVFKNLPQALQVDSVKGLLSTLLGLPLLDRATIAAKFASQTSYANLEQLITDVNVLSPTVGAQISTVGNYFTQQLTAKGVTTDSIAQFKINLAGSLLQILQGEVYYKPTPLVTLLGDLLGVPSSIVYGVVNGSTGLVTPFAGEIEPVGTTLMDHAKVMSRLSGEL